MDIGTLVEKWSRSGAAEHFCDLLGVERPHPATGHPERDRYVFEKPVLLAKEDNASVGHVDLFKEGHFILEAKQGSNLGSKRIGTARRGTPAWNIAMRDAYGQALGYAQTLDDPPPFIVTTDIGHCFELFACFDGSGNYRAFPNAQTNRIYLSALLDAEAGPRHLATLRAVFSEPHALDPSRIATKVTREVAGHLAELARTLEEAGHAPERVAKFLMRSIFTMFAEDVGLLPDGLFKTLIREHWLPNPPSFVVGIRSLWKAMNEGGDYFVGKLLQFSGGLFKEPDAVPLTGVHLKLLQEAAACDWSQVEPAIFGTLLERALDAHERHSLGAHYTPRAYVERLVRPTIEEPLRAEWDLVRAEVRQLVEAGKEPQAKKVVRAFYDRLCHTRVLDPACGTGNFLYVTLDLFKRLEAEVVSLLGELEETQVLGEMAGYGVTPQQFLGIEVKPWAKEIAELVLWIGYLQWHFRTRGRVAPPEPVLRDYGNIECRDAVLAYDREELVTDKRGRAVSRWDGRTYKKSAVTGEDLPDERATVPLYRYVNPRKATWPKADFIVGNPPFIGNKRMRAALGDGYVEALRAAHDDVPETCDFVMYWWNRAAHQVGEDGARRFGLITTNSIAYRSNRPVLAAHAGRGVGLVFAIPDHPWVDSVGGADVRIAVTVGERSAIEGRLARVVSEHAGDDDGARVEFAYRRGHIHPDLTVGPNVLSARPLLANERLSYQGPILVGEGFRLSPGDLPTLGFDKDRLPAVVHPYVIGRDIVQHLEERYVIDFYGLTEEEARSKFPRLFQHVLLRVKPQRDLVKRKNHRERWWVFGEARPGMRRALAGLQRYVATVETSTHKPFVFLSSSVVPDHKLYVIASDDPAVLGVLSSRVHLSWALAAGGRLGIGNDPTWTNTTCFLPFPFPVVEKRARDRIGRAADSLDSHRRARQASQPSVTLTGMYNVLAKLRSGEELTPKEKEIHEKGLVSVLRDLHDKLDAAVFDAYGWPHDLTDEQILERLVALNAERASEEARGLVRWLRPEFQNPEGARQAAAQAQLLGDEPGEAAETAPAAAVWPKKVLDRVAAVRALIADGSKSWTVVQVARVFKKARRAEVEEVLTGLAALGLAVSFKVDGVRRWRVAGRRAA